MLFGTPENTYFGTMTNNVVKYSESKMKCSFFTKSAKFLVNKLPLYKNEIIKIDNGN